MDSRSNNHPSPADTGHLGRQEIHRQDAKLMTPKRRYWLDRGAWLLAGGLIGSFLILYAFGTGYLIKIVAGVLLANGIGICAGIYFLDTSKGYVDNEWEHFQALRAEPEGENELT